MTRGYRSVECETAMLCFNGQQMGEVPTLLALTSNAKGAGIAEAMAEVA